MNETLNPFGRSKAADNLFKSIKDNKGLLRKLSKRYSILRFTLNDLVKLNTTIQFSVLKLIYDEYLKNADEIEMDNVTKSFYKNIIHREYNDFLIQNEGRVPKKIRMTKHD